MKQKLLNNFRLRAVMFVAMMCAAFTGAWADDEVCYTLDGTITGGSNGYATESEITQDNMTWMVTGNTTMSPWRIGGKNLSNEDRPLYSTSAISDNITKVIVTNGSKTLTVNSMTLLVSSNADFSNSESVTGSFEASSTTTFTRPANSDWSNKYFKLVYNVTAGSSNQYAQLTKMEFYKAKDSNKQDVNLSFPQSSYTANLGESFTAPTLTTSANVTVTYSSSKETVATVNETSGAISLVGAGVTTITASFAGDDTYNSASAQYSLTVVDPNANDGSVDHPYTVAEARAAIDAGAGTTGVYATGIVSKIVTAYNSQYGNISYNISEDGLETSDQLQAYRGFDKDGVWFTSEDDVQVGDVVVIYGNLKKHNSTYEFDAGNQRVSFNRPTTPTITASPATLSGFTYEVGNGPSAAQQLTIGGANLTDPWSASLDDNSNFEFSFSETDNYSSDSSIGANQSEPNQTVVIYVRLKAGLAVGEYSGTITITSQGAETVTVNLSGSVTAPEAANVTWDLSTNSYNEVTNPAIVTWTSNYATMTNSSENGGTSASNYLGGDSNNRTSSRFYNGNTLTITPVAGYSITSIEFEATSANYASALEGSTWTNATAAVNGTTVTVTPTNGAAAVSATIGGTCGFTSVKVYYEAAAPSAPVWATFPDPIIIVGEQYKLNLADYVSGYPTPTITIETGGDIAQFESNQFSFTPTAAGFYEFTFKAENSKGSEEATLGITVDPAPATIVVSETTIKIDADQTTDYMIVPVTYTNFTEIEAHAQLYEADGVTPLQSNPYTWITVATSDNDFCYKINETNTSSEARSAYCKVVANDYTGAPVYSDLITITQAGYVDPNAPGTENNPYTVADVLDLFANNTVPTTEVYVQGIISEVKSQSANYANGRYYISDDGTTTDQFYVYNGKYLNGADFTEDNQIQVGDEVVIYGTLTTYSGTNEFAAGSSIISLNRPTTPVQNYAIRWTTEEHVTLYVFGEDLTTALQSGAEVAEGTTITISPDYEQGYEKDVLSVEDVTGAPVTLNGPEAGAWTFTMPGNHVSITATAKEKSVTPTPTGDQFVKVTSTSGLTDGDYLIVYEDGSLAFDGGLETLDAANNTIDVTIDNDAIARTDDTYAARFTIAAVDGGYTVQAANGQYIGQTSDANGLKAQDEAITNTIDFTTDGDALISAGGAFLRYNATSGQERFRYYKSSSYTNQKAIALYKLGGEPDTRQAVTLAFENVPNEINLNGTATYTAAPDIPGLILPITYTSNNEKVVIVDENTGEIGALAEGTATITATFAGDNTYKPATASYSITVVDPRQELALSFENVPSEININETVTYTPTMNVPVSLTLTYSSNNDTAVTVDENSGEITALAVGTATITASFAGNDGYKPATASYTITVVDPNVQITYYALVAQYGDKYYALTNSVSSGTYAATEVAVLNGKVIASEADDIAWTIEDNKEYVYIINKAKDKDGHPQYLGHGSSTTLTTATSASENQKWTVDTENNTWINGSRSFIYRETANGFKNYATTNAGQNDYSDYTHAYTIAEGYTRDVTAGNWGTICLPYNVASSDYAGVTFYSIAGKVMEGNNPVKIALDPVTELAGGVPYIFQVNEGSTKLVAAYNGEYCRLASANGLYGSYDALNIDDLATPTAVPNFYVLSNNIVQKCGTGCSIGANRAYINMDEVIETDGTGYVKFLGLTDTATGIRSIEGAQNDAVIFNMAGQRVNKTTKGVYIVNGKKTLVK